MTSSDDTQIDVVNEQVPPHWSQMCPWMSMRRQSPSATVDTSSIVWTVGLGFVAYVVLGTVLPAILGAAGKTRNACGAA